MRAGARRVSPGSSQASSARLERPRDDRVGTPPGRCRRAPAPSPAVAAAIRRGSAARPSARAADSGYANAATRRELSRNAAGIPSEVITTASTGFSTSASPAARSTASATSSAVASRPGRTARSRRRPEGRPAAAAALPRTSRAVAEPSMSTGFATLASRRQHARAAPPSSPPRGAAAASPAASQASAQRIPRPPAFVRIATRRPVEPRLARQQRGDVDQLLERLGADHARLVEQRVDRRLRAGQRGRVRAGGPLPHGGGAALEREDRLAARDTARQTSRSGAGSRTTRGRAGSRSSRRRPPTTRAGRSLETSALLPTETNAERPSPRVSATSSSASPSAPLCDEKPMWPGGTERAANVAFRLRPGDRDAEAVRPDQPRTVRANEREEPLLPGRPLAADLGEAGRDDDERAHARARAPAPPRRPRRSPGTQTTARSTGSGISAIERVAAHPRHRAAVPVDRITRLRRSPRSTMLRKSSPPIEPRRLDAPITATLRGWKNGRSDAVTPTWSRSATRAS